ncbi:Ribonucleoprotein complex [Schizosaccharomyces pombe]|uniref:Uncharacterized protein C1450.03 n=1 Tax=Schizosaccharomyces pombe (strain 972 / ATCC 24843) TaxID=284812 RepID=YCK3_SCHPO|nr:putative ribonucleoprotein complex protein [Schizosaccharomyces pombe]Q9Y7N1.1 RecName: Full=Uncharacterized protein C1450.03 [Schizosaccharomyces pombe 972h-]CAB40170.1 ribonucleoprotein (RNP) complex (predicted) [Schizosaccharomyces pombe]|eukprot:NP_588302.1 putative ribonucleoprotein complex protein [Schizosaccharomyces pombe]
MAATTGNIIKFEENADSKDLLEQCLNCSDVGVVSNTVRNMDGTIAADLARTLIPAMLINMQPSLAIWLHWIIVTHGGYLTTVMDLQDSLVQLHEKLVQSAHLMTKIFSLSGKLNMVLSQEEMRQRRLDFSSEDGEEEEENDYIDEDVDEAGYDIEVVDEAENDDMDNDLEANADAFDESNLEASLSPNAELSPRKSHIDHDFVIPEDEMLSEEEEQEVEKQILPKFVVPESPRKTSRKSR